MTAPLLIGFRYLNCQTDETTPLTSFSLLDVWFYGSIWDYWTVLPLAMAWRDYATPIIAKVLKETKGKDEKAIKKALYDAYPFGERKYHPYKIWLDEIKVQRGLRTFGARVEPTPENQTELF